MRFSGQNSVLALVIAAFALTSYAGDAEARKRGKRHAASAAREQSTARSDSGEIDEGGKYAAYVVDDNTGKVLFDRNGTAPRHPASLTKMMTLYLLFEDLERGKVRLDTAFTVSAHASAQSPSKLGLRPGDTIEVEDAIKALVTRSANDAAVVIAENLGGSEGDFAERMTRTARRIGMPGSTFYNASGLPDSRQYTTARDMVVLGSALAERFPTYYRYFSTRSFTYKGEEIGNHNRLLGRVEGVDGIKTGYTQASGFNLVSSVRRDGRHVVAAVMGGSSGGARDRHMAKLLETYTPTAYAGAKRSSLIADAGDVAPKKPQTALVAPIKITADPSEDKASIEKGAAVAMARAVLLPDNASRPAQANLAAQPMSIMPKVAAPVPQVALAPLPPTTPSEYQAPAAKPVMFSQGAEALPPKAGGRVGEDPKVKSLAVATISTKDVADLVQTASVKPRLAASTAKPADDTPAPVGLARVPANAAAQSGWLVQIGAFDKEADARALLSKAQSKVGSALKGSSAATESVGKGSGTLYRARFVGFNDQNKANAACSALKQKAFSCLAMKR